MLAGTPSREARPGERPVRVGLGGRDLPICAWARSRQAWGAVVAINATTESMTVGLRAQGSKSPARTVELPALGVFKVPFLVRPPRLKGARQIPSRSGIDGCAGAHGTGSDRGHAAGRRPEESYSERSSARLTIAFNTTRELRLGQESPAGHALFLSLHGAGVEAIGQADAYSPKTWGHLVCPTNRRPYGFDWEDWGRLDALEVSSAGAAVAAHGSGPRLPHGAFDGRPWHLAVGCAFSGPVRGHRASAGWISFNELRRD